MPKFKPYNQNQSLLLPPLLSDCLPKSHICFMINDIVDNMDLSAIEKTYSDIGSPAYDPRLMTKVLFYGHTQGIRSSRKIENRMNEDIAYRYLAANQLPDHGTISLFRKDHLSALKDVFPQIVALGNGIGLTDYSDVSIDGTKCQANASRKNLFDQTEIDKLKKRFDDYFTEAEEIDAAEDKLFGESVGYNMIPGMDSPEKRKKKIKEMLAKMEKLKKAEKNIKDKQAKTVNKEEKNLKKNSASNITDPDANLMRMKDKSYKMAYNAQFATSNQIIAAYELNNEGTDTNSLQSMIKESEKNTGAKIKKIKADAGYFSIDNLDFCDDNLIDAYIPDEMKSIEERQERKNEIPEYDRRNFRYDKQNDQFICPKKKTLKFARLKGGESRLYVGAECGTCPRKTKCTKGKNRNLIINFKSEEKKEIMRNKLNTKEGKNKYLERMYDVEPVIGNIKYNQSFSHFLCRGKPMALIELGLASTAHNLVKIYHWMKKNNKSRNDIQWNTLMRVRTVC
jgi:transposase